MPTADEWQDWISATAVRAYCKNDPLLDWLNLYGEQHGLTRDDHLPGYDVRTDFLPFILRQGQLFEQAVLNYLEDSVAPVTVICTEREHVRSEEKLQATMEAMSGGRPLIGQAVLWNPGRRTYGAADLLIRSDLLRRLFPDLISEEEARIGAFKLGMPYHYRVIDVKFSTLGLLKDGHVGGPQVHYMAQVWIYNDALGHMQGFEPPAAYLLGRGWSASGGQRGRNCIERLGRVNRDFVLRSGISLEDLVAEAAAWVRRVRSDGAGWQVVPKPSVPQLYPNMTHNEDQPWHEAKKRIASELDELTLLWYVGAPGRDEAHRAGITRWTDPQLTAAHVGINGVRLAPTLNAILEVNRSTDGPVIRPDRVHAAEDEWRQPGPVEFYVDFETVSNLADDFSRIPEEGGQPLIFMIGCGHLEDGRWRFSQWTADRLDEPSEAAIIDAWLAHMDDVTQRIENSLPHASPKEPSPAAVGEGRVRAFSGPAASHDLTENQPETGRQDETPSRGSGRGNGEGTLGRPGDASGPYVIHWSPAEPINYETEYNSAKARHPDKDWPDLRWFDFLNKVVKAEPVVVRGAMAFGLKAVARAMRQHGCIQTEWTDGPTDGLGAMVGAWSCDAEAQSANCRLIDLPLMQSIAHYNEVDCRVMQEIVEYLRRNH